MPMHPLSLGLGSPVPGLLAHVGNTPLVRLDRIVADTVSDSVEVWAKLESFNPGGSVKDRAALSMVLAAERSGQLRSGQTILDASSGNTGIAYGMIAAARGYRVTLCLPANANAERKASLNAFGVEIIETDRVHRIEPLLNERVDSPRNRYRVDGLALMKAEARLDAAGLDVVGYYHSYPDHPARYSDYDRDHALPNMSYLITSVIGSENRPMIDDTCCWRLREDRSAMNAQGIRCAD